MVRGLILLSFTVLIGCSTINEPKRVAWDTSIEKKEMKKRLKRQGYIDQKNKNYYSWPKANLSDEKLCFIGDTGMDRIQQKRVSEIYLSEEHGCTRVYHLGDIIYFRGIKSKNDPELEKRFLKYYKPFRVPFYLTLGNHDYYGKGVDDWLEIAQENKNLEFPYYYWAQNLAGVCIVGLDTQAFHLGALTKNRAEQQIEWLKSLASQNLKKCRFKVLVGHHPYKSPNVKRQPSQSIVNFYEKYIVGHFDLILSGHDHVLSFVGTFKGTDQLISGAGGKWFAPKKHHRMDFKNYLVTGRPGIISMQFSNKKVNLKIENLLGENFDKKNIFFEKSYPF